MRRWLLRRTLQALVTLAVALVILFLLMHVLPGDPLSRVGEGRPLTPRADRRRFAHRYGLDRPLLEQLCDASSSGSSAGTSAPRSSTAARSPALLLERLPATLLLGGTVLLLNFTVGLWLGVRQAVRKDRRRIAGSPRSRWPGYATPSFWLGLVLAWLVGVRWRLLPPAGMRDPLLAPGGLLAAVGRRRSGTWSCRRSRSPS